MATKNYTVKYRRKLNGKTDYRNRLLLLKSMKTRLVIRKSLNNIHVQFVSFDKSGDKIVAAANSKELEKKYGWKFSTGNVPAAYLTGYLCGIKAKHKNIKDAIVDLGLQNTGERLYAVLKGVLDAGINVPHSNEIIPKDDRIYGIHITNFVKSAPKNQFSKNKPENIKTVIEDIKNKINRS
ncbi:MAG: 50S ribosomal protein L18 [Nanoarchaeota archaeon]|nr:50S ribosomal protein L18 [Nanoarchaeota archaeon]MBU0962694.1 50S ribosomal protein L18 [Nanoarchaeota archaeon]